MPGKYQENFHPAFKAPQPNTLGNVTTKPQKRFGQTMEHFRPNF
jgi:hypothetical protein